MIVSIAKGKPKGTVVAPPSKSYSHRDLIAGMLSSASKVSHLSYSEDVLATLDCASALGFRFEKNENSVTFLGTGKRDSFPVLQCRESGSTLRFFLPIALALCPSFALEGTKRLIERGIQPYVDCFSTHGISFKFFDDRIEVTGFLKAGVFEIDGSTSSQYITGLLFALPLLPGDSRIRFVKEVSSWPYVEMTLSVLDEFGIRYERVEDGFLIPGGQRYAALSCEVEGDESNAAFLNAFASLGSDVKVLGLRESTKQGDAIHQTYFSALSRGFADLSVANCIDLCPVLFAFSALNHGGRFTGTKRLAIKESNRAEAMKEELQKAGIEAEVLEDEVIVRPTSSLPTHLSFSSHNDHRIAMALSLFSTVCPIEIEGAECVKKSYPDYFRVLSSLGLEVKEHD